MYQFPRQEQIKKLSTLFLIGSVMLLFYIYIIINNYTNTIDVINISLYSFIGLFSIIMIVKSVAESPYSLNLMHWIFCFIFWGISSFIQYLSGSFVYSLQVSDIKVLKVLIIIVLWMLFFYIGGKTSKGKGNKLSNKLFNFKLNINSNFVIISTFFSVLIVIYTLIKAGFDSTLSRSTEVSAFIQETQAGTLIYSSFMKYIIVYGLAISIIFYINKKRFLPLIIIQFICCLIVNSPIGMSRFNVAIIYIGLMLITFTKFRKSKSFIWVFFIGFVFLFPMINVFRHASIYNISFELILSTIDDITTNFLSGDYDAFSMVVNTLDYIKYYGVSNGYQLLGPLLFFIPRSIWPTKPFGSGHTVRVAQGEMFTNVSSPLIAEGLINFGIIGVIILAFLFGRIVSSVDQTYWKSVKGDQYSYIQILYPFLLSMFFFMNRGDLLSTFSFAISHVVILGFMFWLNNSVISKIKVE